jgi:shikimate kinase
MSAASPPPEHPELAAIAARITRPVVLVGLMGVGKSTVGRKLASLLGRDFVDADEAIVEAAQRSIPEIFEAFGEAHFRDGERRVIARLIDEGHGVIATGGGAFVDPTTRAAVLEKGIAVWIDCDIDTLVERTSRRGNRPLLKDGDPREILTRLARERAPFYGEAHIRVVSEPGPHADTARAIIEAIDKWL